MLRVIPILVVVSALCHEAISRPQFYTDASNQYVSYVPCGEPCGSGRVIRQQTLTMAQPQQILSNQQLVSNNVNAVQPQSVPVAQAPVNNVAAAAPPVSPLANAVNRLNALSGLLNQFSNTISGATGKSGAAQPVTTFRQSSSLGTRQNAASGQSTLFGQTATTRQVVNTQGTAGQTAAQQPRGGLFNRLFLRRGSELDVNTTVRLSRLNSEGQRSSGGTREYQISFNSNPQGRTSGFNRSRY